MKKKTSKKAIRAKMATALNQELGTLSVEMKKILIDDLVCAFENRLKILSNAQSSINFSVISEETKLKNTLF